MRKNLGTSTCIFPNKDISISSKEALGQKEITLTEQKGLNTFTDGVVCKSKQSRKSGNHPPLDRKQSFCLEATLKHLDLEVALLPSI